MSDSGPEEKKASEVAVQPAVIEPHAADASVVRRLLMKTDLLVMPGLCRLSQL